MQDQMLPGYYIGAVSGGHIGPLKSPHLIISLVYCTPIARDNGIIDMPNPSNFEKEFLLLRHFDAKNRGKVYVERKYPHNHEYSIIEIELLLKGDKNAFAKMTAYPATPELNRLFGDYADQFMEAIKVYQEKEAKMMNEAGDENSEAIAAVIDETIQEPIIKVEGLDEFLNSIPFNV